MADWTAAALLLLCAAAAALLRLAPGILRPPAGASPLRPQGPQAPESPREGAAVPVVRMGTRDGSAALVPASGLLACAVGSDGGALRLEDVLVCYRPAEVDLAGTRGCSRLRTLDAEFPAAVRFAGPSFVAGASFQGYQVAFTAAGASFDLKVQVVAEAPAALGRDGAAPLRRSLSERRMRFVVAPAGTRPPPVPPVLDPGQSVSVARGRRGCRDWRSGFQASLDG